MPSGSGPMHSGQIMLCGRIKSQPNGSGEGARVPLANSAIDVVLQLLGLFYAFAGYIAVRAVHQARLIDMAIDVLSAVALPEEMTPPREHQRALWLLIASLLILAGGIALLLQMELAAWIFLASATLQIAYLLFAAPHYFDDGEKPDGQGRQGSNNAAMLYVAATVFVLWALQTGRLKPLSSIPLELAAAAAIGVAVYAMYALWKFARPFSWWRGAQSPVEGDDDSQT